MPELLVVVFAGLSVFTNYFWTLIGWLVSTAVYIAAAVIPVWHDSRSAQQLSDAPAPR
ncbi:hypothetical protein ACEE90_10535 [Corynebacterium phoceense]